MAKWRHRLDNIDPVGRTATCAECGPVAVRKRRTGADGQPRWRCGQSYSKGGIRYSDEGQAVLTKSDGKCGICGETTPDLVVDHDHQTGAVRGALCRSCNLGLGYFKDDPIRLQAACDYLGLGPFSIEE